jgi:hypothetical protein
MSRWIHRYLDPADSLLEVLFGLVMAFTMTAGARLLFDAEDFSAVELAIGLLGCNVAWGIIDAAFYLLGSLFDRNRRALFVRKLQAAADEREALTLIETEFDFSDEPALPAKGKADLHQTLLKALQQAGTGRARLRGEDFAAAALIAVLVSVTAVPGLAALAVVSDSLAALRVANFVQLGLLFLAGYGWARFSGANPWHAGSVISVVGVLLILVAVALGG